MFGRKPHNEIPRQENEEPKFSRRKFLKMGVAAGATALMKPDFSKAETIITEWKEGVQSVREEGIKFLKHAAQEKENEQYALFISKNNKAYWRHIFNEPDQDARSTAVPIDIIQYTLQDPDIHIEAFHTHPLSKSEKLFFSQPSCKDIFNSTISQNVYGEGASRVTYSVADASGIWHWEVEFDHPVVKIIKDVYAESNYFSQVIPNELKQQLEAGIYKNYWDSRGLSLQLISAYSTEGVLTPDSKALLAQACPSIVSFVNIPEAFALFASNFGSGTDFTSYETPSERKQLMDVFKNAGFPVSFTPYSKN